MASLPKTEKIICERDGGWLTIWFNSPENRNALSAQLTTEFLAVLNAIQDDRSIRGVTLRGKGGVFCAGGDLKSFSMEQKGDEAHANFKKMNYEAGELFDKVLGLPQVVVAYVQGAAIAGGLGLMCCADIIIVEKAAKFSLTETKIGIAPAQIAPIVVGRTGLPIARRIMLTGARFFGKDTPDYNLSDCLVEDEAGYEVVLTELKKGIYKCAPGAIGMTKEILMATAHLDREGQKQFAAEKFADAITSDEGREGIASFVEKRKPSWAKDV
jgi:isohexenylglutaconyl-CoA hydratase